MFKLSWRTGRVSVSLSLVLGAGAGQGEELRGLRAQADVRTKNGHSIQGKDPSEGQVQ